MNHTDMLKRAWHTVWSYRALWIFGVILALVTFSWKTAALLDTDQDWTDRGIQVTVLDGETFWDALQKTLRHEVDEANRELSKLFATQLGIVVTKDGLTILGVLAGVAVTVIVVAKIARYASRTALIRMVGTYLDSGERVRMGRGFRWAWSRRAWRLFLIDLTADVVAVLFGILLFGLILAPLPLWVDGGDGVIFTFAILTGSLFFMAIFVMIVAGAVVSVWKRLARQACALEGIGVTEALRRGKSMVRSRRKDAGLIWLLTIAVELGWSVITVPLVLLLIGLGLLIGGLPGLAAGGLTGLASRGDAPLFVGLALGIPIFLLVTVGPVVLLSGMREVFVSTLWTLTYRELRGMEGDVPDRLPAADTPSLLATTTM